MGLKPATTPRTSNNPIIVFLPLDGKAFTEWSTPRTEFWHWMEANVGRCGKEWQSWDHFNDDGSESTGRDIWVYSTTHALLLKLFWGGK